MHLKLIVSGPVASDGADSIIALAILLSVGFYQSILFLLAAVFSSKVTVGGGGKSLWGKSFAFSSKVVVSVGSVGPWIVGVVSHFRGLVYCKPVKLCFPCSLPLKVFQWFALVALILCKYWFL